MAARMTDDPSRLDPREIETLRSIMESILLETMFDLPTLENVSKVVVDESTVIGEGKPLLIYSDPPKVAGSA